MPRPDQELSPFEKLGLAVGSLVTEKNAAYGDSFSKSGEFLKLLFPNGVPVEQFTDALAMIRIFDKMMRIATHKDAFGEDPFKDIAGYAILGQYIHQPQVTPRGR